jgi:Spy/CpxP family protein refolding chaperone
VLLAFSPLRRGWLLAFASLRGLGVYNSVGWFEWETVVISRRMLFVPFVALVCCASLTWSQDSAKEKKAAAKSDDKKPTNRLPANYGKLGLTDAQKDKVYAIQDKYEKQVDELEAQLKAIKAKRESEVEAVLSAEQKKILKDLNEEAKESKSKPKKSDDKTDK